MKLKPPLDETLTIEGADLEEALQYVQSRGIPRLVNVRQCDARR